ncbi:PKD domain-containing protein [Actinosynnema sp. NPDC059335]|uniref:PKD domain-containing protein n=1 Tax=Actinosynnema sp. NPDC059335 TaxID=3346804 RepID=UPI00366DCE8B
MRRNPGRGRSVAVVVAAIALAALLPGVAHAAPPANDDFDQAVAITALPFADEVNLGEATGAPDDPNPCYHLETATVWYSFTPTEDVTLAVDFGDSWVESAIFTGSRGALRLEPGTCESGGGTRTRLDARAGVTYHLLVRSVSWMGVVWVTAEAMPPTPNDHFADRKAIDALPVFDRFPLATATVEAGEPVGSCDHNPGSPSVWYTYTPAVTETIVLDADSWAYRHLTVAAVYTGTSLADLTEVACASSYRTLFRAEAGRTLQIQVNAADAGADDVSFGLSRARDLEPGLTVSPAPASIHEDVYFGNRSHDPEGGGTSIVELDFGDGTVLVRPTAGYAYHRYAADGDYTARLTVEGWGGRTATTKSTVTVRTHDVAVTGFAAPTSARVGATRTLEVEVANTRYDETVAVTLYRGGSAGYQAIGTVTKSVPARPGRVVRFAFDYTFTAADLAEGNVVFKAVAEPTGVRDAAPTDNTVIAPATVVLPKKG